MHPVDGINLPDPSLATSTVRTQALSHSVRKAMVDGSPVVWDALRRRGGSGLSEIGAAAPQAPLCSLRSLGASPSVLELAVNLA